MSRQAEHPYAEYRLYVVHHKTEGRRMACLVKAGSKDRTTISYARYLMSVHLGRILEKDEHVDHINGDRLDDRVENFQLLSQAENSRKSAKGKSFVNFVCPVCKTEFQLERRQSHKDSPTCSRKCGGIKSHWV